MTRYLVDTHVWLWFAESPDRLPSEVRQALLDPGNEAWISVASIWEIAIKTALGRLTLSGTVDQFVAAYGPSAGFALLPIEAHHAVAVAELPQYHGDPFDRLLICQAQLESMTLVTADAQMGKYSIATLWSLS